MSKTNAGNFFEDFTIGQVIRHAVPRTVTEGDRALYTALYGTRCAVQSSDAFARSIDELLGAAHRERSVLASAFDNPAARGESFAATDKGTPPEREGRKASGLTGNLRQRGCQHDTRESSRAHAFSCRFGTAVRATRDGRAVSRPRLGASPRPFDLASMNRCCAAWPSMLVIPASSTMRLK